MWIIPFALAIVVPALIRLGLAGGLGVFVAALALIALFIFTATKVDSHRASAGAPAGALLSAPASLRRTHLSDAPTLQIRIGPDSLGPRLLAGNIYLTNEQVEWRPAEDARRAGANALSIPVADIRAVRMAPVLKRIWKQTVLEITLKEGERFITWVMHNSERDLSDAFRRAGVLVGN
jgi:hypothetical protein